MSQVNTSASYEAVYNTLRKRILHLELTPGTMVSEIETSKEFSVSRTPVRDAFKALVNEGLLEVRPHIGTFVTLIDLDKISDLLYIREVMEKAIIKELTHSFNPSQEFKLKSILHNQYALIENPSLSNQQFAMEFIKCDYDFHHTLYTLAGKANLVGYFDSINAQYNRFRTFLNFENRTNAEKVYNEHLSLLEGIKTKNLEELDSVITHHIYDGFNNLTELMSAYPNYFKALD